MQHIKTTLEEIEKVVDITCDCCGQSCAKDQEDPFTREFMVLKGNWGFHSKKDFEQWEAHICEDCVDEKFKFIKFIKTKQLY